MSEPLWTDEMIDSSCREARKRGSAWISMMAVTTKMRNDYELRLAEQEKRIAALVALNKVILAVAGR